MCGERTDEVWKRPHDLSEDQLVSHPPCKIAFSFISNCSFLQDDFSKRKVFLCWCIILTELFKMKCFSVWMWGGCTRSAGKKCIKKTLHVVSQLQDTHYRATAAQIELNQNKLSRLWPTQIRTLQTWGQSCQIFFLIKSTNSLKRSSALTPFDHLKESKATTEENYIQTERTVLFCYN